MRLVLLGHAATAATRTAAFPADEPLEAAGRSRAGALTGRLPRADRTLCAPSTRCRQTAEAAGVTAVTDAGLAGCDFGGWTGRTLDEVAAEDEAAVTAWLTDPSARPHGGETIAEFVDRIGRWLDDLAPETAAPTKQTDRRSSSGDDGDDGVHHDHGDHGGDTHHRRREPRLLVIADPTLIRAAVVHAIGAPPLSIWRIDVAPLSRTILTGGPGRWSLRSLAR